MSAFAVLRQQTVSGVHFEHFSVKDRALTQLTALGALLFCVLFSALWPYHDAEPLTGPDRQPLSVRVYLYAYLFVMAVFVFWGSSQIAAEFLVDYRRLVFGKPLTLLKLALLLAVLTTLLSAVMVSYAGLFPFFFVAHCVLLLNTVVGLITFVTLHVRRRRGSRVAASAGSSENGSAGTPSAGAGADERPQDLCAVFPTFAAHSSLAVVSIPLSVLYLIGFAKSRELASSALQILLNVGFHTALLLLKEFSLRFKSDAMIVSDFRYMIGAYYQQLFVELWSTFTYYLVNDAGTFVALLALQLVSMLSYLFFLTEPGIRLKGFLSSIVQFMKHCCGSRSPDVAWSHERRLYHASLSIYLAALTNVLANFGFLVLVPILSQCEWSGRYYPFLYAADSSRYTNAIWFAFASVLGNLACYAACYALLRRRFASPFDPLELAQAAMAHFRSFIAGCTGIAVFCAACIALQHGQILWYLYRNPGVELLLS